MAQQRSSDRLSSHPVINTAAACRRPETTRSTDSGAGDGVFARGPGVLLGAIHSMAEVPAPGESHELRLRGALHAGGYSREPVVPFVVVAALLAFPCFVETVDRHAQGLGECFGGLGSG